MSNNTNQLSRRRFLKGAAYVSALSMGGLPSLAAAKSPNAEQYIEDGTVTLLNQSNKVVALDAKEPISLDKKNGYVVLNIHKASEADSQVLNINAGEELVFTVGTGITPTLTSTNQHGRVNCTVFVGDDNYPASLYGLPLA